MMYKITRVTPGGLLTTFLVALMICSALVESRPNSPVLSAAQRKPPFNGSIFGKRSQIAPSEGVEIYYEPQMVYGGTSSGGFGGLGSSGTNNFMLGDIIRPRDSPIRTTMNRCLSLSQREVLTASESRTLALCQELFALAIQSDAIENQGPLSFSNGI